MSYFRCFPCLLTSVLVPLAGWCGDAAPGERSGPIRVALYAGTGTGDVEQIVRAMEPDERIDVTKLESHDILAGRLDEFDVLLQPGGSGSAQGKALGVEGRANVRRFVERGGGYVGVCAGSYLATCDYEWSLGILDAKVVDRKHWARGFGKVDIGFSDIGRSRLDIAEESLQIYYHQGPLLAPAGNSEIDDYMPLAIFKGEIARNGAPRGVMPGTTAIAAGRFGEGHVICFSPHPEKTEGQERLLLRAVALASKTQR